MALNLINFGGVYTMYSNTYLGGVIICINLTRGRYENN